jgi:hypothetical protein
MTDTEARAIAADMLEVGHFVFEGVSWAFYKYFLGQRERTGSYARVTFDRGVMEVRSGAGRAASFNDRLRQFMRGFSFDDQNAPRVISDLAALDDVAYFVACSPPDVGLGRDEGAIRVCRETIVWSETGCTRRPGPLRFHANFSVAQPAFPGIDLDVQLGFMNFDWKGKLQ